MSAAISFRCPHCALQLKVKEEHAGRSTKCPTCKQPLVVPQPSLTEQTPTVTLAAASSLDQAGLDGGVTLDDPQRAGSPRSPGGEKSVRELLAQRHKNSGRYILAGELGRGGMGAVARIVDCDLRREVAVKYLLNEKDPKKKARFIEEAVGASQHCAGL